MVLIINPKLNVLSTRSSSNYNVSRGCWVVYATMILHYFDITSTFILLDLIVLRYRTCSEDFIERLEPVGINREICKEGSIFTWTELDSKLALMYG